MKLLGTAVLASALLAGCIDAAPGTARPIDETQREAAEQTFGPDYPAQLPPGGPMRIDTAVLSPDHMTLTVTFVGGKPYLAADPCSQDYEPWVATRADELDVMIVNIRHPEQATLGVNQGCTAEGYGLTYHLRLAAPFNGTTAKDLSDSADLFVGTPPGVVRATVLPSGWALQREFEQEPGPPVFWLEIYASAPVGDQAFEGPGRLLLYQAFGMSEEWTGTGAEKFRERGAAQVPVVVNGAAATVWDDAATGDLLLAWTLNGQSLAMWGNAANMSPQDLARFASAVQVQAD